METVPNNMVLDAHRAIDFGFGAFTGLRVGYIVTCIRPCRRGLGWVPACRVVKRLRASVTAASYSWGDDQAVK